MPLIATIEGLGAKIFTLGRRYLAVLNFKSIIPVVHMEACALLLTIDQWSMYTHWSIVNFTISLEVNYHTELSVWIFDALFGVKRLTDQRFVFQRASSEND